MIFSLPHKEFKGELQNADFDYVSIDALKAF